jgi:hypothetical protein
MRTEPRIKQIPCTERSLITEISSLIRNKEFVCCKLEYPNGEFKYYGMIFVETTSDKWERIYRRVCIDYSMSDVLWV